MPAVSVIVPAYNAEAHLVEALECALTQDLRDLEVVCVDDGSTDRTAEVVRALAEVDPRLKLVEQPNRGAAAARNAGLDVATGQFVAFLDADDRYEETSYLRVLLDRARESGAKVAAGCLVNWRGEGRFERDFQGTEYDGYQFSGEGELGWEDWQFDYGFHRFLFSRELFADGAHRFDATLSYYEDPVFLVGVLRDAGRLATTDRAHYLYRCGSPRFWTTRTVLDLLEGARRNLRLSREAGYARLHWYTLWHVEYPVWEMGIGPNRALALDVIDAKLREVEAEVDQGLLAQAGERRLPHVLRMRTALDGCRSGDPLGRAYRGLRYAMAHRG